MMFKNFSRGPEVPPGKRLRRSGINFLRDCALCLYIITLAGCALVRPDMPAANLQEPGWKVREGQAVWYRPKHKLELAGELTLATRSDGSAFVQFTKSPFPIMVAQSTPGKWSLEIPAENKRYGGRGNPPKRLMWLYLARVADGEPPPENWTWREGREGWRLENHVTGEAVEGYFNP